MGQQRQFELAGPGDRIAPIPDLPRPCPGTERFDAE